MYKSPSAGTFHALPTRGEGDCALHAIFGKLDNTRGEYYCDNIAEQRQLIADAIVRYAHNDIDGHDYLFGCIATAIMDLIIYEAHQSPLQPGMLDLQQAVIAFNQHQQSVTNAAFEEFINDPRILQKLQNYQATSAATLGNMKTVLIVYTDHCADEFNKLIQSNQDLKQKYTAYCDASNHKFNVETYLRVNPSVIAEYARILAQPGYSLLPCEVQIIAYVHGITIVLNNADGVDIYNPGMPTTITMRFNGVDHYERMLPGDESCVQPKPTPVPVAHKIKPASFETTDLMEYRESKLFAKIKELPRKYFTIHVIKYSDRPSVVIKALTDSHLIVTRSADDVFTLFNHNFTIAYRFRFSSREKEQLNALISRNLNKLPCSYKVHERITYYAGIDSAEYQKLIASVNFLQQIQFNLPKRTAPTDLFTDNEHLSHKLTLTNRIYNNVVQQKVSPEKSEKLRCIINKVLLANEHTFTNKQAYHLNLLRVARYCLNLQNINNLEPNIPARPKKPDPNVFYLSPLSTNSNKSKVYFNQHVIQHIFNNSKNVKQKLKFTIIKQHQSQAFLAVLSIIDARITQGFNTRDDDYYKNTAADFISVILSNNPALADEHPEYQALLLLYFINNNLREHHPMLHNYTNIHRDVLLNEMPTAAPARQRQPTTTPAIARNQPVTPTLIYSNRHSKFVPLPDAALKTIAAFTTNTSLLENIRFYAKGKTEVCEHQRICRKNGKVSTVHEHSRKVIFRLPGTQPPKRDREPAGDEVPAGKLRAAIPHKL